MVSKFAHASDACEVRAPARFALGRGRLFGPNSRATGIAPLCPQMLVKESAERWRREEGNYRDDITAIITFLPFLEDWGGKDETAAEDDDKHEVFINRGTKGISKMKQGAAPCQEACQEACAAARSLTVVLSVAGEASPVPAKGASAKPLLPEGGGSEAADGEENFAARRLSVTNPLGDDGDDWDQVEDDEDDDNN